MRYNITIETHRMDDGDFRAWCVNGPDWAIGFHAASNDRLAAYAGAVVHIESLAPFAGDTFSFLHVET